MTKTMSDVAMEMYQRKAYDTLKLFKKTKKKSWAALGINPKMEALIMKGGDALYGRNAGGVVLDDLPSITPINVKGTVTGRLPPKRSLELDYTGILKYVPREIHAIKGISSHGTISIVNQVVHQEKFREDPRFPLMQMMQRTKRLREIIAGPAGLPIFS